MKYIEQLQEKLSNAQKDYQPMKKNIETKVVKWLWANFCIYALEPFYFEEVRLHKGRIHKKEPSKKEYQYQYGLDVNNEIIIERQFTGLEEQFYETFYIRENNKIERYKYDYYYEKKIITVSLFIYENSILISSYRVFKDGWEIFTYLYENGKLSSKLMQCIYQKKEETDRFFSYSYDKIGLLQSIREGEYVLYNKPDKKITYTKLTELVSEKLFVLLRQTISNYKIDEKLYCIFFYYFHEDILPPFIGFGTQSKREEWQNEKGDEAKWKIWSPADYSHSYKIQLDEETQNLFNLYNQETSLSNKENSTIKMLVECCKKLKESIHEFDLNRTDDFVIIASDYEQGDLKKNFKLINPEIFDKFQNKLV
ncbi:MAG TPA: hypothetical protein PKE17_10720 [Saprospiraceae bacterium]|nr:hypothetical protein [Saprospiraceae bacterium]